jgi:hypothetical protein
MVKNLGNASVPCFSLLGKLAIRSPDQAMN